MITLKPGLRLKSAVCDTQMMVVRGSGPADLRCGGAAMLAMEAAPPAGAALDPVLSGGTLIGKRYENDGSVELLCTKGGAGSLTLDGAPLGQKQAKALPSSD